MNGQNSSRNMEISSNLNLNGVNGTASPKRSTATPKGDADGDQDRVTLTDLSSLKGALENTPASRSDAVAQARTLIADPTYPNSAVVGQVSQFLAEKMLFQQN